VDGAATDLPARATCRRHCRPERPDIDVKIEAVQKRGRLDRACGRIPRRRSHIVWLISTDAMILRGWVCDILAVRTA
jgi:hypothetical protein